MTLDHEARRHRVGASEVAAILGLSEYQTPLDVWQVKTGRKPHFEGNEHTRRGQRQERQILEWLAEDLGGGILALGCNGFTHPTSPIAAATPDALWIPWIKSGGRITILDWPDLVSGKVVVEEGGEWDLCESKSTLKTINEDNINEQYSWLLQCQWQMMCTGLKKCHLAIFGPRVSDYQRFEISYNESLASKLLADVEEWWQVHIVGDVEPEPINEADVLALFPQDDGTSIEAVDALYEAICSYSGLKAQIKDLTAECEPLRERIVLAIGKAQNVRYGGRWVASFKTDKRGIRALRT